MVRSWQDAEKGRQRRSRIAQRLNEGLRKPESLEGLLRSPRSMTRANGPTKCGPYLFASSLAAALLDGLFEPPARCSPDVLDVRAIEFLPCSNSLSADS